jgi:very-short-patch-repair endonuclease
MWWREWCVIGEADGLGKYDYIAVLRREKVREDRLRALGMTVVRWTWDEMWNAPGDVVARILAAKSLRSRSRNAG